MSFILDALKKSEAERARQAGPALLEMRIVRPKRRVALWVLVLALLLSVNLAVLVWFALRREPTAAPASAQQATPAAGAGAAGAPGVAAPTGTAVAPGAAASATGAAAGQASTDVNALPPPGGFVADPGARVAGADETDYAAGDNPADLEPAAGPAPGSVSVGRSAGARPNYSEIGGSVPELRLDLHVYGSRPQDRYALINMHKVHEGSVLREHVTINRSTRPGGWTEVGADCYLMTASHVAHDCQVGDFVVMANAVLLAGHVQVGARAFLGGAALFHQFVRVGESVMVSGGARVAQDVAPYAMAAERNEIVGLNLIGLKRRGFDRDTVSEIKRAFRAVYLEPGNMRELAAAALRDGGYASAEARHFLEFFGAGKRGFARARRAGVVTEE